MSDDDRPLRLLSLDGGGVRGLSSLIILQYLMQRVDPENPPKPCEYFNLIGGTSTGGLIAIMLGRLKMEVGDCIKAYTQLSEDVFQPRRTKLNIFSRASDTLKVKGRFDSKALKSAIQNIVSKSGEDAEAKLKVEKAPKCRVFVAATRGEMELHTVLLRSYDTTTKVNEVDCTIWEAGRATSAASSFFDPIKIGEFDETFLDGATGCNNPVEKLLEEADGIWGPNTRRRIRCLVSIGTGQPSEKAFGSGLKGVFLTLAHIATETEQTARRFYSLHGPTLGDTSSSSRSYFRFNVTKGLEEVGLESHTEKARIASATKAYLDEPEIGAQFAACAIALRGSTESDDRAVAPVDSKLRIDCLRSLAFSDMDTRLHGIEPPNRDTCQWLFTTTQFRNWRMQTDVPSHNRVMWIKGEPGAGKSTLMKQVWLHLKNIAKDSGGLVAAYFFHGRAKNPLEKSPLGMIRSITYQLVDQDEHLFNELLPLYVENHRKHGEKFEWNLGELKAFLLSLVKHLDSVPVFLLVDALDECDHNEARSVVSLLERLSQSAVECGKVLNICLASRHYPDIRMKAADEVAVDAQSQHNEDIAKYIQENLWFIDSSIERQELEKELLQKANHVFLWVSLVLQTLKDAHDGGDVIAAKKALQDVPSDLRALYLQLLMKGREAEEIRECVLMLLWVLFAKRQLTVGELYFAVSAGMNPEGLTARHKKETGLMMKKNISRISRGLLESREYVSDGDSDTSDGDFDQSYGDRNGIPVEFVHESIKDFLLRQGGLQELDSTLNLLLGKSHDRLANCCLSYFMMEDIGKAANDSEPGSSDHESKSKSSDGRDLTISHILHRKDFKRKFPFLKYATVEFLYHLEQAEIGGVSQIQILQRLQWPSKETQRLSLAIEKINNSEFDLDYYQWHGGSVIHPAAMKNYQKVLWTALDVLKFGVNTGTRASRGIALREAAGRGHLQVVEMLLKHGADVNAKGGHHYTALNAAVQGTNLQVAQMLLQYGADVNAKGGHDYTALHAAVFKRNLQLVQMLLQYGADVNANEGYSFGTALQRAAYIGEIQLVKMFLEHGADVNAKGGNYYTALQAAACNGHLQVTKMLLEHGAEVNARNEALGAPLYEAMLKLEIFRNHEPPSEGSISECKAMIKVLLENGGQKLPPIKANSDRPRNRRNLRKEESRTT